MADDPVADLLIEHRGPLVVVTLDRPRALNAITFEMCQALDDGLRRWASDPTVGAVLIQGSGDRAFCAGGDIRWLYDRLTTTGPAEPLAFYRLEYPMNARLHHFPKPYVSLLDGITMGGGVGASIHGSHRVVTERTMFAMPETGIGFFPDVGATYFLPRTPGALGIYLGLTGARLDGAACLWAGLGTSFVRSERLLELTDALASADLLGGGAAAVDAVIGRFATDPGPAQIAASADRIDACFGHAELADIVSALTADPSPWAATARDQLATKSPTSLAVTCRQLREGAGLEFDQAMRLEYRLVHGFMTHHDFREGVRALIVDKDNRPDWQPAHLDQVTAAAVDDYFRPPPDGDLALPDPV